MQQEENQTEDVKADVTPMEDLGTSWKDYSLQIDNQLYHFPMKVTDLEAMGWNLYTDYEDPLTEIDSACDKLMWFANDNYRLDFVVYNPDLSRNSYENCVIAGVLISYTDIPLEGSHIFLPGGIIYGQSTADDVLAVFTNPKYNNKLESGGIALSYQDEDLYSGLDLMFDDNTGVLNSIEMKAYDIPEGYESKEVDENAETITNYVYVTPTELGNDIKSATILFGGDLYTLPAPVSAFLDNGWSLENGDELIRGGGGECQDMTRNGESFQICAVNNSVDAAAVTDCYVEELSSAGLRFNDIVLPGNIEEGMAEEELIDSLKQMGTEYQVEEFDEYKYYQMILAEPDYANNCRICVSEGVVQYITICKALKQ